MRVLQAQNRSGPLISIIASLPGGYLDYKTGSNLGVTNAATVAMPAPTNAMNGSNKNCGNWYTVSPSFSRQYLHAFIFVG